MARRRRKRKPQNAAEPALNVDARSSAFSEVHGAQHNTSNQSQVHGSQYNVNITISLTISKENTTIAILTLFLETRVLR